MIRQYRQLYGHEIEQLWEMVKDRGARHAAVECDHKGLVTEQQIETKWFYARIKNQQKYSLLISPFQQLTANPT